MPLFPVPIDLPPDVVELRSGDVDGDGIADLVAVERKRGSPGPDSMAVSVLTFEDGGKVADQWRVDLGTRPLLLDIESGLWALAADGIYSVNRAGLHRVVDVVTPLQGLGDTTPVFADVFVDLEADGIAEAVVSRGGVVRVVGVDGRERARVRGKHRGELEVRGRGGVRIVSAAVSPDWRIDDIDGDGIGDLLLPSGDRLTAVPITADGSGPPYSVSLPLNINPRRPEGSRKQNETRKDVVSVWLRDMDGDGRTDFAAQLWVTEGSWMGAEGELVYARGTGSGFGPLQRMPSDNAVLLVRVLDLDADGDVEIATAEIDFGVGNLTRAMLTQKIRVDVHFREMDAARYRPVAELHRVVVPVGNDRDPPVKMEHDVTGDGIADLVTSQDSTRVEVFEGTGSGYSDEPVAAVDVGFEQGEHKLWVGNVAGDDRAEIVIWKLRTRSATVLLNRP